MIIEISQVIGRPEWHAARLPEGETLHDYFVKLPSEERPTWSNNCAFGHWHSLEELLYELKLDGNEEVIVQIHYAKQPSIRPGIQTEWN